MAYDEELADRVRALLSGQAKVTEKRMFGGLAFLLAGKMAVGATSQGGLMIRVDPDDTERLLATTPAEPMVMRGAPARGWLRVDAEHVRTKRQLERWVKLGVARAGSL